MHRHVWTALGAATLVMVAQPALARDGCGRDFHRGPRGHCRPNRGPGVETVRIGVFYPGRGYWDGRRYWQHRERWRGGWRYR